MNFDVIIIGAGSAGSVLADRLSEDGQKSILVLEAGPSDRKFWIQVPLGYGINFYNPNVNWAYHAEPDPGLNNRCDYWPRGKVLGGSSSINAMIYIRGHPNDYDDWRQSGNPGWSWNEVLPHFKAIEHNEAGGDEWRGEGGGLYISDVSSRVKPYCNAFIEAGKQIGLPFNKDFNGKSQEGVGYYQITTRNGTRMSASRAFLRRAMKRHNTRVVTNAHVCNLNFEGRYVTGVTYQQNEQKYTAHARQEVILSAGAINTPQILMLSGIGPGSALRKHDIKVVHDNPNVGQNMQDHMGTGYTFGVKHRTLNERLRSWPAKLVSGAQYLFFRRGPLSLSINYGGGFFRTDPDRTRPNMQIYFQAFSTITEEHGKYRAILTPDPFPAVSLGLSSCRPTSKGHIEIASKNPLIAPRIFPNAYHTRHDIEEMLSAMKFLRKFAAQDAFTSVITKELKPGREVVSDTDMIDYIRQSSGTVYHPCGTCRMGSDPAISVVDPHTCVHGVGGIRIIDASIFPNIVSGNTNGPVMMTAHRAAALILEKS